MTYKQFILVLVVLGICFTAILTCNKLPEPKKELSCKNFDVRCEMDKDYQFVKILEQPDSTCIDGYGKPIVVGKWYMYSNEAAALLPISTGPQRGFMPNDFENADKPESGSMMRVHGDVKSEKYLIECKKSKGTGYTVLQVKLLLFGSRYVDMYFDGIGPRYSLNESK